MSSSDAESSDFSCTESPQSQSSSSPYSPSQRVPFLESSTISYENAMKAGKPYLLILEEPKHQFRFRYKSEREDGTHGCLIGANSNSDRKTFPKVQLVNFTGKAYIKCTLIQHNNDTVHPHTLLENTRINNVGTLVPQRGTYEVSYPKLSIIHTAKRDVKKFFQPLASNENHLKQLVKNVNLNKIRLRFSAVDAETKQEICFNRSCVINNMKSVKTNQLKIDRTSKTCGRPRGGDDVFLLVDKVDKKDIEVLFYEEKNGITIWTARGEFLQRDVHHQYAIVCKTPAYRNQEICSNVDVFMQLRRPTDGAVSNRILFTYKPEYGYKQNKRIKIDSESPPNNAIQITGEIKIQPKLVPKVHKKVQPAKVERVPQYEQQISTGSCTLSQNADVGMFDDVIAVVEKNIELSPSHHAAVQLPVELEIPQNFDDLYSMSPEEVRDTTLNMVNEIDKLIPNDTDNISRQYVASPSSSQHFDPLDSVFIGGQNSPAGELMSHNYQAENVISYSLMDTNDLGEFSRFYNSGEYAQLFADLGDLMPSTTDELSKDSGKIKMQIPAHLRDPNIQSLVDISPKPGLATKTVEPECPKETSTSKTGQQLKSLLQEINKDLKLGGKESNVKMLIQKLFTTKLTNGDTYLHQSITQGRSEWKIIAVLVHMAKMPHLLNMTNDQHHTVLHLAIMNNMPDHVSFLLSKGCDPMCEDEQDNNALHYAVMYKNSLEFLLDSIKDKKELDAYNMERQTPLHLTVLYDNAQYAHLLLSRGASGATQDSQGRTPLHLAANDDRLDIVTRLLEHMTPSEINTVDSCGYTALQVACDGNFTDEKLEIIKLLLKKQADPFIYEDGAHSAWELAKRNKRNPKVFELMKALVPEKYRGRIVEESDGEYESADDGDEDSPDLISEKFQKMKLRGAK